MRPVSQRCEARNEHTTPLQGKPYHSSSGIIYAVDLSGKKYAVSRVERQLFDEQNFQYVFSPEWSVIDSLPATIFQGIPGLDLSLRLERYYRVNMTPYFISERTPGEGREDLWELLEEVGLDYYDRFEWLLRTDLRSGTDNLIVERTRSPQNIDFVHCSELPFDLQPDDQVSIPSLDSLATTSLSLRRRLLQILRSGVQIWDASEERFFSEIERNALLRLLLAQEALDSKRNKTNHEEGITKAKREGKYMGRKKISVDPTLLQQIAADFHQHKITESEAMKRLGISSRSTFYRRLREAVPTRNVK